MQKNSIKNSNKTNKLSAKTNQNCKGKGAKKRKFEKSLDDYDQNDYQAIFENCKVVMKGWTKEELEAYLEMNNECMKMLEKNKEEIMDLEKRMEDDFEESMKDLDETEDAIGNNMTMKQKRDRRQAKMEKYRNLFWAMVEMHIIYQHSLFSLIVQIRSLIHN